MGTTLSNGYKKPQTGDRSSSWMDDIEFNIERVNSHKHDGIDSEKLNPKDFNKPTATILAASWGSDLGGSTYKQTVNLPANYSFDETYFKFIISGGTYDGTVIYPSLVKVSSTSYDVYINDNTLTLKVVYG